MSVLAEFVGGPLDGELREMPDARPAWYFPYVPYVPFSSYTAAPVVPHDHLTYEKAARRDLDAPTGEPVYRYILVGKWPR